ncbi:kelch-like protein 10 [Strongylocentrotus purpuratus]|uniref:BTB domain-containing protein n=1 Tax=Strongylocentrotus purpuratus TaxID=7668 RepID=A0A7M7P648_STRPU|nr:kelch-like protein 10 [Strongylocentrotus purpuratus]
MEVTEEETETEATPFTVFNELRKNKQLCDVSLEVGDQTFPAHRNVLAACSRYFRALFTIGMHETDEKVIKIPGVEPSLMEQILDYIYTKQTPVNSENVVELLPAADQFNVEGLVKECCAYLEDHFGASNCVGMWRFARSYFCFLLEQSAFRYILNHFEEVALGGKAEEFLELTIEDLECIVKEDELNVKMEEYVFEALVRWVRHKETQRKQCIPRLLLLVRLGMINTDYFMNSIKAHPLVRDVEECRAVIIQTIHYTYNFDPNETPKGPSAVLSRPRLPFKLLFAVGGWSGGSPTSAIECYDTRADRWVLLDTVNNKPRAYMGIAVLNQKLYAVGGFDSNQYFNSVRCFDPVKKSWIEVAPMNSRRCYVSVSTLGEHVYAMGGFDGHTRLKTVERYDPSCNQWTLMHSMNHHRSDASACRLDDKIVIVGGFNGNECLNSAEVYDPELDEWRDIPRMNSRRSGVGAVAFRDSVYAVGGFNGLTRLNSMERWKPGTMQWIGAPSMYIHRSNFGVAVLDDMIFVIGGFNGITTIYNVECYDPDNDEWYDACDMNVYRSALSIGVVSNLPNVREFTWPRDRDLPPPAFVPTQASLEQAAIAMEESNASSDERVLDDEEDDEPVNQEVADEAEIDEFLLQQAALAEENAADDEDYEEEEGDDDDDDDNDDVDGDEVVQFPDRSPNMHRHPGLIPLSGASSPLQPQGDSEQNDGVGSSAS